MWKFLVCLSNTFLNITRGQDVSDMCRLKLSYGEISKIHPYHTYTGQVVFFFFFHFLDVENSSLLCTSTDRNNFFYFSIFTARLAQKIRMLEHVHETSQLFWKFWILWNLSCQLPMYLRWQLHSLPCLIPGSFTASELESFPLSQQIPCMKLRSFRTRLTQKIRIFFQVPKFGECVSS